MPGVLIDVPITLLPLLQHCLLVVMQGEEKGRSSPSQQELTLASGADCPLLPPRTPGKRDRSQCQRQKEELMHSCSGVARIAESTENSTNSSMQMLRAANTCQQCYSQSTGQRGPCGWEEMVGLGCSCWQVSCVLQSHPAPATVAFL